MNIKHIRLGAACVALAFSQIVMSASGITSEENENAVTRTIMSRRSIRKYQEKPVDRAILAKLGEYGINAPSAMNKQPWEVRIVDSPEFINGVTGIYVEKNPELGKSTDFRNVFRNAPAVMFIAASDEGNGMFDCGLFAENVMLAAESMGLGTCCLGSPVRFMMNTPECKPFIDKLEIPEGYSLLYAIAIGYPDEEPVAKPRNAAKVRFVD